MEDLRLTEQQNSYSAAARASFNASKDLNVAETAHCLGADGLLGMLATENVGGLDTGLCAAIPVMEVCGEQLLAYPLAEHLIAVQALEAWLPELARKFAAGEAVVTVAWLGHLKAERAPGGWRVHGSLGHVPLVASAQWLIAMISAADIDHVGCSGCVLLDLTQTKLVFDDEPGLDLERPRPGITLDVIVPSTRIMLDGGALATRMIERGSLLHAAEMVGTAEGAINAAIDYVKTRRQFGRPLSAFQAVRHLLARDHIALIDARRCVMYAGACDDVSAPDRVMARHVMGTLCGDYCRQVTESAMHLHGAMGFTFDLPLHRRVRRVKALSAIVCAFSARESLAEIILA